MFLHEPLALKAGIPSLLALGSLNKGLSPSLSLEGREVGVVLRQEGLKEAKTGTIDTAVVYDLEGEVRLG